MTEHESSAKPNNLMWDSPDSFGWISIALHWLTAVLITVLWFVGKSIAEQSLDEVDARRGLHVSLAACSWLILVLRIAWRARAPHPRASGQSMRIHQLARGTHYAILGTLLVMLVSGPVTVWAQAKPTRILDFVPMPVATDFQPIIAKLAAAAHATAGSLLLVLAVLHIGGALKQLMFSDDETIVRMLWPARK